LLFFDAVKGFKHILACVYDHLYSYRSCLWHLARKLTFLLLYSKFAPFVVVAIYQIRHIRVLAHLLNLKRDRFENFLHRIIHVCVCGILRLNHAEGKDLLFEVLYLLIHLLMLVVFSYLVELSAIRDRLDTGFLNLKGVEGGFELLE